MLRTIMYISLLFLTAAVLTSSFRFVFQFLDVVPELLLGHPVQEVQLVEAPALPPLRVPPAAPGEPSVILVRSVWSMYILVERLIPEDS
jgi:hypothetical protein